MTIINEGSASERKALCDTVIDRIDINLKTSTTTPIFRIDLANPARPGNAKRPDRNFGRGA